MAEHGTPDPSSSQAPFIQALVQKSVTAITKLAGRLSFRMLREQAAISQGQILKSWNQRCGLEGLESSARHKFHSKAEVRSKNAERNPQTSAFSLLHSDFGRSLISSLLSRLRAARGRNDAVHA